MLGNSSERDIIISPDNISHIQVVKDLPVLGVQIILFKELPWEKGIRKEKEVE